MARRTVRDGRQEEQARGARSLETQVQRALGERGKLVLHDAHLTPAAVLVPLFYKQDVPHVLLTKRTTRVLHHKGQISFPGGARDPEDSTLLTTALREAREEVGIHSGDVRLLGELDDVITNTRFVVSPYVGVIPYPYEFTASPEEIDEVLEVPLSTLLEHGHLNTAAVTPIRPYPAYTFEHEQHIIWGITARILRQFLDVVFGPQQGAPVWTGKSGH